MRKHAYKIFASVVTTVFLVSLSFALAQEPDYDAEIQGLLQKIQELQAQKAQAQQQAQQQQQQPEPVPVPEQAQPKAEQQSGVHKVPSTIFLKCSDGQGNQVPCSIHVDPEIETLLGRIEAMLCALKPEPGSNITSAGPNIDPMSESSADPKLVAFGGCKP